jgi:hypothetical protein
MSEAVVSTQAAVEQLRKADQRWTEAIRAFDDYPTRLRNLAEAADLRSRALTLAHLANITGKPRPGARGLRALAFELSSASDRPGPKAAWQRFDRAVKEIGAALEEGDIPRTAAAFSALVPIANELADTSTQDAQRLKQAG